MGTEIYQENKLLAKATIKNCTATVRKSKRVMRELRTSGKKYQFGIEVPKSVAHALKLDQENKNHRWRDAMTKEMKAMEDNEVFEILDENKQPPKGYTKIPLIMIFTVKQDGTYKARLVAGGHVTGPPKSDVYASVVKSENVRLLFLLAEIHHLDLLMGDVSNAYLNALTNEKVYAVAGPEFGEFAGRIVILLRSLYGLKTSGNEWHAHFADALRSIGFKPSLVDSNLWMRQVKKWYEYICTHTDDFVIASKETKKIMEKLLKIYKIRNIGPPSFLLGADIIKQKNYWTIGSKTYVTETIKRIEAIFGQLAKHKVPMIPGDHPEEDTSEILSPSDRELYQMLIGMAQWIVSLGRLDIIFSLSSLNRFSSCPREGHMNRILKVFGYLKKYPNRSICINATVQDYGDLDKNNTDWTQEYGDAEEDVPTNAPKELGPSIRVTCYVDSDHAHDTVTRRSVTGFIIVLNSMPFIWFSKRQGSVEASTYGAEFVATRISVEHIKGVRYSLRMLGVKIDGPCFVFGDNLAVVSNATIASSMLKKKHLGISYHLVREAVAAGIISVFHIDSEDNPANPLTKSEKLANLKILEEIFFYRGNCEDV
ncbi:MAG: reverse transcriptase domain-containing protein [Gloeomargaritales cyanobacterium]